MTPRRLILLALLALALPSWADPAPSMDKKQEQLAGEDDKALPTAQPTVAADVRGLLNVTRSAQAAPAFQLPDFVVTGSGERKALARRDEQNGGLDTSGGLRASPGEKGAGKDQMATKAERSSADERTYTARAGDGWIRAAYGLANTASLDGMLGQAQGPWVWSLQGAAHNTDGGPTAPGGSLPQRRDAALKGALSFDSGGWGLWDGELEGEGRSRRWATTNALPDAWLERDRSSALGAWSGQAWGTGLGFQLSGSQADARLQGQGTAYREEGGKLGLSLEKTLSGRTGQTSLMADGSVETLSQRQWGQRQLQLWDASLRSRFEPFSRALLTLGLGLDAVTGDDSALLLGPRVEWQQRISRAWGFDASLGSGLSVSRLQGGAWTQDYRLPDNRLPASRQTGDLRLNLNWQASPSLTLELGAFGKQNESHFLADDPGHTGLWVDTPVRNERELGGELKEGWKQDALWQEASVQVLRSELNDLPGATATFAPVLSGRLAGGGRWGSWKAWLAVEARSEEAANLAGTWTLPAAAAVSAEISDDLSEALTVFVEGRNLAAAPWGDAPAYNDPAPYAGLGLEWRF